MPIKPIEMSQIYYEACDAKGYKGNEGQLKIWRMTLAYAEKKDLQQALTLYWQENTDFPMPAELRHLVERARRERLAESSEPKEFVEYECPECHAPFSTFVSPGDVRPRICMLVGYDGQLTGCSVKLGHNVQLTEIGHGYKMGSQKRA
jgi:hypothetical protein